MPGRAAGAVPWEEAAEPFCEEMAPLVARAKELGVRLAVEPTNPLRTDVSFVHSRPRRRRPRPHGRHRRSSSTSTPRWYERGLDELVRKNIDVVALVQICDYKLGTFDMPNRCAVGDGDIPVERLWGWCWTPATTGPSTSRSSARRIEEEGYRSPIARSLERASEMLDAPRRLRRGILVRDQVRAGGLTMARYPKPAEGSWTEHYPRARHRAGLLRGLRSRRSSTSWSARRSSSGRGSRSGASSRSPAPGASSPRTSSAAQTSIIVVRGRRRRAGVPQRLPPPRQQARVAGLPAGEETSGTARQFTCKYHGWRYGLDGACTFAQQEGEFFDLDRADYGLVPVHCEVFAGFIFVNLAKEPSQSLREFLGPMILGIEDYPFHEMTDRYAFRVECRANWKVFSDAFMEFYHAPVVHVGQHPRPPPRHDHRDGL